MSLLAKCVRHDTVCCRDCFPLPQWADIADVKDLESERDALKTELEDMRSLAVHIDARSDLWQSRVQESEAKLRREQGLSARYREALEEIGYAQGDGHPLALMKVAREALKEHCYTGLIDCHIEGPHHHNENDPPTEAEA